MEDVINSLELESVDIAEKLQTMGVAGAGGAGFPSYAKWTDIDSVNYLMVNHQESEPNYYADKWIGREYAEAFGELFDVFFNSLFDVIVIGTKEKYRSEWTDLIESRTGASVVLPENLPTDISQHTGVVVAYTPDVYTYSEESVLLMVTTGTQIKDDLPTDHGWIVHNTETLFNILRALGSDSPVTHKFIHVDGNTPSHRCLKVPLGTPAAALLESAGVDDPSQIDDQVLVDGGPGWCYEIDDSPEQFGVRKRTNAILMIDEELARENTQEGGQIEILEEREWTSSDDRPHEKEPTELEPNRVRIPRITNLAYEGFVKPSVPVVSPGDTVSTGAMIAEPHSDGISNAQHASIDGVVADVTDTHIIIERS
jgi:Na+-translocating ferredoxin:NAD+ oxidoreductase RnfC subunit